MAAADSDAASAKQEYSRLFVSVCLAINVALSIAIVLLNKLVYANVHFPNMTLTFVHFVFTTAGMLLCRVLGVFVVKPLPLLKMAPISITFCGFVALTNLSLQTNTVGTYQIIKTLTMPCIMVLQATFYRRSFSTRIMLSTVPIAIGVFLNSWFDLKFNIVGIVYAFAGVFVTALYQVWVGETQQEFACNAMQLLYYQAPMSAIFIAFIIPVFEPVFAEGGLFGTSWSPYAVFLVCSTGVIAFAVNLSIYWIIGNTSPLTYNMIGHLKFCMILIGGFLLFHDPVQIIQIAGIFMTFIGLFAYTHVKMEEERLMKAAKAAAVQTTIENEKRIVDLEHGLNEMSAETK